MTTRAKILVVIGVVIGLFVLYLVAQRSTTEPAEASTGAKVEQINSDQYRALAKAAGALLAGDVPRVRRILHRAFGRGWQMRLPRTKHRERSRTVMRGGCAIEYFDGSVSTDVIGAELFNASMSQRWCWKRGSITKVFNPHVDQDVTGWGEFLNWSEAGITRESQGWTNYGGKHHGGHYVNYNAYFHGCAPVPTGCILPTDQKIRLSLVVHAGGGTDTAVGRRR